MGPFYARLTCILSAPIGVHFRYCFWLLLCRSGPLGDVPYSAPIPLRVMAASPCSAGMCGSRLKSGICPFWLLGFACFLSTLCSLFFTLLWLCRNLGVRSQSLFWALWLLPWSQTLVLRIVDGSGHLRTNPHPVFLFPMASVPGLGFSVPGFLSQDVVRSPCMSSSSPSGCGSATPFSELMIYIPTLPFLWLGRVFYSDGTICWCHSGHCFSVDPLGVGFLFS